MTDVVTQTRKLPVEALLVRLTGGELVELDLSSLVAPKPKRRGRKPKAETTAVAEVPAIPEQPIVQATQKPKAYKCRGRSYPKSKPEDKWTGLLKECWGLCDYLIKEEMKMVAVHHVDETDGVITAYYIVFINDNDDTKVSGYKNKEGSIGFKANPEKMTEATKF